MSSEKVLIIGAGLMGSGIAQTAAESGYTVYLNDISEEYIDRGIQGIIKRWDSKKTKGKINDMAYESYVKSLVGIKDYSAIAKDIDIVIEAASERFEIKESIFKSVSALVGQDTIIASNTSSISITKLAASVNNPERFIGMHFFSPVPVMKLLEVIPGLVTSEKTLECALNMGKQLGKVCVVSKDSAGFIVNRLLDPMLNEAIRMLDEGVGTVEGIDNSTKYGLNHPMGPFELLDMTGIDVEYAVMQVLHAQTGNPHYAPAPLLRKMVESGMIGKKSGRGFYVYHEDGTKEVNPIFK